MSVLRFPCSIIDVCLSVCFIYNTVVGSIYLEMVLKWTAFLLRSVLSLLGNGNCIPSQWWG